MPKATYLLMTQKMAREGRFLVRWVDGEIVFEVMALDSSGQRLTTRYVLQIMEFWADPTDNDSDEFDHKFPSAFVCVELNPMGRGEVNVVS
ncbi:hypothetical protein IFM51744_09409 [Aspergillus udagawae]|nr:hypothetical protein IFM51744_09409 [Aspergillus udagawae]